MYYMMSSKPSLTDSGLDSTVTTVVVSGSELQIQYGPPVTSHSSAKTSFEHMRLVITVVSSDGTLAPTKVDTSEDEHTGKLRTEFPHKHTRPLTFKRCGTAH